MKNKIGGGRGGRFDSGTEIFRRVSGVIGRVGSGMR